jgi:hypothetical protein
VRWSVPAWQGRGPDAAETTAVYATDPPKGHMEGLTVAKISAQSLSDCIDQCRRQYPGKTKYFACTNNCEGQFMLGDGNTQADDGNGGKVFTDTLGGKVFIDAEGGKVFQAPGG